MSPPHYDRWRRSDRDRSWWWMPTAVFRFESIHGKALAVIVLFVCLTIVALALLAFHSFFKLLDLVMVFYHTHEWKILLALGVISLGYFLMKINRAVVLQEERQRDYQRHVQRQLPPHQQQQQIAN